MVKDRFTSMMAGLARTECLLAVASAMPGETHGYAIAQSMSSSIWRIGHAIERTSVYRMLDKLEQDGHIKGEWVTPSDSAQPRKEYRITKAGADELKECADAMGEVMSAIDDIRCGIWTEVSE